MEKINKTWVVYGFRFPHGKWYIGQSCDLKQRMGIYRRMRDGRDKRAKNQPKLSAAMVKYRHHGIQWVILKDELQTLDQAFEWERFYIKLMNSIEDGYNIQPGGRMRKPMTALGPKRREIPTHVDGKLVVPYDFGRAADRDEYSRCCRVLDTRRRIHGLVLTHEQQATIERLRLDGITAVRNKAIARYQLPEFIDGKLVVPYAFKYPHSNEYEKACYSKWIRRNKLKRRNLPIPDLTQEEQTVMSALKCLGRDSQRAALRRPAQTPS